MFCVPPCGALKKGGWSAKAPSNEKCHSRPVMQSRHYDRQFHTDCCEAPHPLVRQFALGSAASPWTAVTKPTPVSIGCSRPRRLCFPRYLSSGATHVDALPSDATLSLCSLDSLNAAIGLERHWPGRPQLVWPIDELDVSHLRIVAPARVRRSTCGGPADSCMRCEGDCESVAGQAHLCHLFVPFPYQEYPCPCQDCTVPRLYSVP